MALLLLVVAYGVAIFKFLDTNPHVGGTLQWLVTLLSSAGLYRLLLRGGIAVINASDRLLAHYWGPALFWRGLWHYTSEENGMTKLGVWRIDQDALGMQVQAFGLDENYSRRFTAFSITDVMEASGRPGVYEVVNARNDYDDNPIGDVLIYSKTRMVPESPVKLGAFLKGPAVIRGETIVYGGSRSGALNRNVVLTRHAKTRTESDLIDELRAARIEHGKPTGPLPAGSASQSAVAAT